MAEGGLRRLFGRSARLLHSDAGIAASAERAVADSLDVENDRDRKSQPTRSMSLVKSGPAASSISPQQPQNDVASEGALDVGVEDLRRWGVWRRPVAAGPPSPSSIINSVRIGL
jgi:hypothetical protein